MNNLIVATLVASVQQRCIRSAAAAAWPDALADIDLMLTATAIDVERAAHDDSGARAAVARAMLNERGPVQRAADDYLDYVTYAPLSAQALRERHRAELAMGTVAGGDQPASSAPRSYRTTPIMLGVDSTASFSWLSTDLFQNFTGTLGLTRLCRLH